MKKIMLLLGILVSLSSLARADEKILCSGPTQGSIEGTDQIVTPDEGATWIFQTIQNGTVIDRTVIDNNRVKVSGTSGFLITAQGFSFSSFLSGFGCIRNVDVIIMAKAGETTDRKKHRFAHFRLCQGLSENSSCH